MIIIYLIFIDINNLIAREGSIFFNELIPISHSFVIRMCDASLDIGEEQSFLPFLEPLL